jgi:hypothetical protein
MANVREVHIRNFSGCNVQVHAAYLEGGQLVIDFISDEVANQRLEEGEQNVNPLPHGGHIGIGLVEAPNEEATDTAQPVADGEPDPAE